MLMSLRASGLISGEPFHFIYHFPTALHRKNDQGLIEAISFRLSCFEYLRAQHGPEFDVS